MVDNSCFTDTRESYIFNDHDLHQNMSDIRELSVATNVARDDRRKIYSFFNEKRFDRWIEETGRRCQA